MSTYFYDHIVNPVTASMLKNTQYNDPLLQAFLEKLFFFVFFFYLEENKIRQVYKQEKETLVSLI